jgi:hypothetical protein
MHLGAYHNVKTAQVHCWHLHMQEGQMRGIVLEHKRELWASASARLPVHTIDTLNDNLLVVGADFLG